MADLVSLAGYWQDLLESLPIAADGPAFALRAWLAGHVPVPHDDDNERSRHLIASLLADTPFKTFDTGLEAIIEHARLLGVPPGASSATDTPALVYLGADGQLVLDACGNCDEDNASGLNAIGGGRILTQGQDQARQSTSANSALHGSASQTRQSHARTGSLMTASATGTRRMISHAARAVARNSCSWQESGMRPTRTHPHSKEYASRSHVLRAIPTLPHHSAQAGSRMLVDNQANSQSSQRAAAKAHKILISMEQ